MILIFIFIIFLLLIILLFFSSPKLSPIPYFPSNKKDLPLIIKTLNLNNNQIIFDLGAGDGIVIFEAAKKTFQKKLNSQFVAVEINPFLILLMYFKRLFHPNKKNIKIICEDIFKMNFNINSLTRKPVNSLTFYLYVSPWHIEKIIKNLKIQKLKDKFKKIVIVSYFYPIPSLKNKERVFKGKNKIFYYQI